MDAGPAIRPMQWTDLDAVAELEKRIHPGDPWRAETWWAELAGRPRRHYLVAELAEVASCAASAARPALPVVGYAGLDMKGDHADVMTIAVDPAHRGVGLGSALLCGLHDEARSRQVGAVLLEVRADNKRAMALYARHHYRTVHTRPGYYQPEGVDAIVLRTMLREQGDPGVADAGLALGLGSAGFGSTGLGSAGFGSTVQTHPLGRDIPTDPRTQGGAR